MNSLREATAEAHRAAEQTDIVKLIFSKQINKQQYASLLANQLLYYSAMEKRGSIFSKLENAARTESIITDIIELSESDLKISQLSYEYSEYLLTISDKQLWAHIYTHYLGDLAGGQMLKRCVPGSGKRFEFKDSAELISQIRMNVSIADATEANCAFDWTIRIYNELYSRIREIS